MQPDFLFVAAFSDRSALLLAMACLFNSAGRQGQLGLSFALLGSETSHAAAFTWPQLRAFFYQWWQFGLGWGITGDRYEAGARSDMKLTVNQIENASLAWICDVFVQEGAIKDPGHTEFHKLILAERPSSVKPSRLDETTLHIVLDEVNDAVLSDIKERLLRNASLTEAQDTIRQGKWYLATMDISPT